MSLGLPEPLLYVGTVTLTSLDAKLVEGCEDADGSDLSSGFPESLDCRMEILSNGIWAGVPEADFLGKAIGERVVGERKGSVEEAEEVAELNQTMSHIVRP